MEDAIHDCYVNVVGSTPTEEQINKIHNQLPRHIKLLAEKWGWNDTEVNDGVGLAFFLFLVVGSHSLLNIEGGWDENNKKKDSALGHHSLLEILFVCWKNIHENLPLKNPLIEWVFIDLYKNYSLSYFKFVFLILYFLQALLFFSQSLLYPFVCQNEFQMRSIVYVRFLYMQEGAVLHFLNNAPSWI